MQVVGWLLILLGGLLFRQLAVGRALDIPTDTKDTVLDLVRGDFNGIAEVASRRGDTFGGILGDASGSSKVGGLIGPIAAGPSSAGSSALVAKAEALGKAAGNRYLWGSSGPAAYDCSGLVWRTLKDTGVYSGYRFTSATFESVAGKFAKRVSDPQTGDIVVWPGHHIGFVNGKDSMFSALNSKTGIRTSPISSEKGTPHYWRVGA